LVFSPKEKNKQSIDDFHVCSRSMADTISSVEETVINGDIVTTVTKTKTV